MFSDSASKYGLNGGGPATNATTELNTIAAPSEGGNPDGLLSPANPLTAFLLIGGIAFGLMAFSTTVRVGNSSASLNLGK